MKHALSKLGRPFHRRALLALILISGTLVVHGLTRDTTPTPTATTATPIETRADFELPPPPAVDFSLPAPAAGPVPVGATGGVVSASARLDRAAVLHGEDGRLHLELDLETAEIEGEKQRVPTDLFVVLDRSGSMGGEKIHQARLALVDLVDQLRTGDRFALVAFSSGAEVLVTPSRVTAERRRHWQQQVTRIEAGGGTNMVGAMDVARTALDWGTPEDLRALGPRSSRLLLLSDGLPDTEHGLDARARALADRGTALSTLGIGDDFNEVLMGRLADLGTGNYYYLGQPEALASVFAGELSAGHSTVARDLEITFQPADGITLVEAAGYPLVRHPDRVGFRPGHMVAGQQRRFWLSLDVDTSKPFDSRSIGRLELAYRADDRQYRHTLDATNEENGSRTANGLQIACTSDRGHYLAAIDAEVWGRATVGETYGNLQNHVADLVRQGKKAEAETAIEGYHKRVQSVNAAVQNEEVEANLEELENLRAEVDDAFEGANQAYEQKRMSKQLHALSQQLRRLDPPSKSAGSKSGGGL